MPTFNLSATVTVSAYTTVEAETLEQAIEIARGRDVEFADRMNSHTELWIIDSPDGSPSGITGVQE